MTSVVRYEVSAEIALITIDNPPVNATSQALRAGLSDAFTRAASDTSVRAVVLTCAGRTFVAGADISEFGKPPQPPFLPDIVGQIEATAKPVITALHGTVLGGGLELALGSHYRIAAAGTKFGLPEVTLGLLPGAGGTQRLPRLAPFETAIEMITTGRPIPTAQAAEVGLIDRIAEGDLAEAAQAYATALLAKGAAPRPVSALPASAHTPELFETARAKLRKARAGEVAPLACVDALEAAATLPFAEGLARERALFLELMDSPQRAALIHAFFSERKVTKLPEISGVAPRPVAELGVIGGGTMGAGIATAALISGLDVILVERDAEAAARARATVEGNLAKAVARGKLAAAKEAHILASAFRTATDYAALANVDLAVEAVFESMEVKRDVFAALDDACKPGAILATNTSYLDINEIARATTRPADVIGLHFFSPAHIMKLLEVVVADQTAPEVTATGFALAKKLRKIAVRAGVCDGFIGNRILAHYRKALDGAVLAGASPFEVDAALTGFGLAMGPFAVSDLAGLDIGWANRKRLAPTRPAEEVYATFADSLCEMGRFGRKTGRGFYVYGQGKPTPDPEVLEIIETERAAKGITRQTLSAEAIIDRFMAAMVNEAARVVEDGIALRPLDVDVVMLNGYGFPRWRGGPMHYADTVGPAKILADIEELATEDPHLWQPAPLLKRLVAEGRSFASLNDKG